MNCASGAARWAASFTEFVREFDAALSAQEAQEATSSQEASSGAPNIQLLRFALGALPELLTVENALQTIKSLLGTTRVRVFATGNPEMLGLSADASTDENCARGADKHLECAQLQPNKTFLVVAGTSEGAKVSPSAPRNQGLSGAPHLQCVNEIFP